MPLADKLMRALEAGSMGGGIALCNQNGVAQTASTAFVMLARGGDKRLMVLLGVKDLVAVDTGDALLIASRKSSQDLRRVVDELARRRLDRCL